MRISVVIPCYYSEATIGKVVRMTRDQLVGAGYEYEFVLVNDGSTDGTFSQIRLLCEEDPNVVGIDCARNLGQHSAIMAGLHRARGDMVMLMDDDMQTHPSQCLLLVQALVSDPDCDIVFAQWFEQKESWWRRLGSRFTEWSMNVLANTPKDVFASNFCIMRAFVRDEVVRYTGPYVYIQGLLLRATSRAKNIEVKHFEREAGTSGYTFKSLIRLWSAVLGFSLKPLRLATIIGVVVGLVGVIAAVVVAIQRLADPTMQLGWSSLMAAMLVCSGVILLFLGLVGEYLGRLFITANNAPQYVVRNVVDLRDADGAPIRRVRR